MGTDQHHTPEAVIVPPIDVASIRSSDTPEWNHALAAAYDRLVAAGITRWQSPARATARKRTPRKKATT